MRIIFIDKNNKNKEIISIGPNTDLCFSQDRLTIYGAYNHYSSFVYDKYYILTILVGENYLKSDRYEENYILNEIRKHFENVADIEKKEDPNILKELGILGEV